MDIRDIVRTVKFWQLMRVRQRRVKEMKEGVNYDINILNLGDCKNTGTLTERVILQQKKSKLYSEHIELLE